MSQRLDVAVIGGGASGTLTAVQLLRNAAARQLPMHIALVDKHGRHGLGQAYSTGHSGHLLNAMAGQMSALPDDAEHLLRWVAATTSGPSSVASSAFLPRQDYGQYLLDTLAAAEQEAQPGSRLTRIRSEAVAIRENHTSGRVRIALTDGQLSADVVVLASGNAPSALPFATPRNNRIITDPWLPGALDGIADGSTVAIVGTGLTMVDLAMTITSANPSAIVHAVSRHGLLPRTHPGAGLAAPRAMWLPAVAGTSGPVRLSELMWQVRSAIAASPASWPAIIASLRPFVPGLWQRMPAADKRLFLRHVARYWEVHRHLVPPPTASRMAAIRSTGQLSVHRGRITAVTDQAGRLRVSIDASPDTIDVTVGWLINGTGAAADITTTASPLLRDLFAVGLARPDPLRLGIDATVRGEVLGATGTPSDVLYTLGPPLRGLWYETTAIPEIRDQAAALASQIIAGRTLRQRPGSAA